MKDETMKVELLNVESLPPSKISEYGTKLSNHSAICLMKKKNSYLLALGAGWSEMGGLYSTAIQAINKEGKKQWDIPWNAFSPNNKAAMTLLNIATDNNLFYVLYTDGWSMSGDRCYINTVSNDGQVLQNLLENLFSCKNVILSPHLQKLCVINEKDIIGLKCDYVRSDNLEPLPGKIPRNVRGKQRKYATHIVKVYDIKEQ